MSTPALIGIVFSIVAGFGGLAVIVASLLRCRKCRNAWHLSEMECPYYEIPKTEPDFCTYLCSCGQRHPVGDVHKPFSGASVLEKSGQDRIQRQDGSRVSQDGPEGGSHR